MGLMCCGRDADGRAHLVRADRRVVRREKGGVERVIVSNESETGGIRVAGLECVNLRRALPTRELARTVVVPEIPCWAVCEDTTRRRKSYSDIHLPVRLDRRRAPRWLQLGATGFEPATSCSRTRPGMPAEEPKTTCSIDHDTL